MGIAYIRFSDRNVLLIDAIIETFSLIEKKKKKKMKIIEEHGTKWHTLFIWSATCFNTRFILYASTEIIIIEIDFFFYSLELANAKKRNYCLHAYAEAR